MTRSPVGRSPVSLRSWRIAPSPVGGCLHPPCRLLLSQHSCNYVMSRIYMAQIFQIYVGIIGVHKMHFRPATRRSGSLPQRTSSAGVAASRTAVAPVANEPTGHWWQERRRAFTNRQNDHPTGTFHGRALAGSPDGHPHRIVILPAPFGPRTDRIVPSSADRLTLSTPDRRPTICARRERRCPRAPRGASRLLVVSPVVIRRFGIERGPVRGSANA
jgi:hypothetical protein